MQGEPRRGGVVPGPGAADAPCRNEFLAVSDGPEGLDFGGVHVSRNRIRTKFVKASVLCTSSHLQRGELIYETEGGGVFTVDAPIAFIHSWFPR